METKEIIAHIKKNKLEFAMVELLLFNKEHFYFLPIPGLHIVRLIDNIYALLDKNNGNLLATGWQPGFLTIGEKLENTKSWRNFLQHPEHTCGYICRYGDLFYGNVIYDKGNDWKMNIVYSAFENYILWTNLDSINELDKRIKRAANRRKTKITSGIYYNEHDIIIDFFNTEKIVTSARYHYGINRKDFIMNLKERTDYIQYVLFKDRYYSTIPWFRSDNIISFTKVSFIVTFKPMPKLETPLNKDVTIINGNDSIADILYKIAIDIKPFTFWAATGYVYESGLDLLEMMMHSNHFIEKRNFELIIGDLKNYKVGVKQKAMNRATAQKINYLKEMMYINHVYTYPRKFYHGKFYYISNGKISYVIVGSSNITKSAYYNNKELDILYRFERNEGHISPLEQEFIDWYIHLRENCIELTNLDEKLFESKLTIDEYGNTSENTYAFSRLLTDEEEKKRYQFLLSMHPSKIDESFIPHSIEYKAFRNYIAFFYPEYSITILERFAYGNSCYIFSSTDSEKLLLSLCNKSKDQVRNTDYYITDVPHFKDYQKLIRGVFI